MPTLRQGADCCGCTACASVCPVGAISMQPDVLGFLYPVLDESRCMNCGACERVCAFNENYDKTNNLSTPDVYGARHKSIDEVMRSRSGAVFVAISDYVLENGGVVYGAGYKDHFRVAHKRAETKADRDEFRGSKYVQSDLAGVFRAVKKDLVDGRMVLFSGTPCQTSGLNSYIGVKLRENLILIDLVCHGVPGPNLWRDFLAYIEAKQGDRVVAVNFRDRVKFGWAAHHETFEFQGGGGKLMWFTDTFYKHIMFRHSCGKCPFANTVRPSDITIADFWGWEKTSPAFNADDKGVSLVLVNTPKGREIFDAIKNRLEYFKADIEAVLQPNLCAPSTIHPDRMQFERDYQRKGFAYVYKKYANYRASIFRRGCLKLKRITKRMVRMP